MRDLDHRAAQKEMIGRDLIEPAHAGELLAQESHLLLGGWRAQGRCRVPAVDENARPGEERFPTASSMICADVRSAGYRITQGTGRPARRQGSSYKGRLADYLGIYVGMKPHQRVEVLLQSLGSSRQVDLPVLAVVSSDGYTAALHSALFTLPFAVTSDVPMVCPGCFFWAHWHLNLKITP